MYKIVRRGGGPQIVLFDTPIRLSIRFLDPSASPPPNFIYTILTIYYRMIISGLGLANTIFGPSTAVTCLFLHI